MWKNLEVPTKLCYQKAIGQLVMPNVQDILEQP